MKVKRPHVYKLENGIDIALYSIKDVRVVHMVLGLNAGSMFEAENKYGTLHFLEHLLFSYSKSIKDPRKMRDYEEHIALRRNAGVGSTDTRYWFAFADIKTKAALEHIYRSFTGLYFNKQILELTKNIILTEQRQFFDNNTNKYTQGLFASLYDTKYFRQGFGIAENVIKVTGKDLRNAYEEFYYPHNIKIAIAGSFENKQIKKILQNTFGCLPSSKYKKIKDNYIKVKRKKPGTYKFNFNYDTVDFDLMFPFPGYKPLDLKMMVTKNFVKYYLNRELFSRLREDKGLVYATNARIILFPAFAELKLKATSSNENFVNALDETIKLVRQIAKNGISQSDFARIVNYLNLGTIVGFSDPGSIADSFMHTMLDNDDPLIPEDFVEVTKKLTRKHVNEFMAEYLDIEQMHIGLMGKEEVIKNV